MYLEENYVTLVQAVFIFWTNRLKQYYVWMSTKNYRWPTDPVSLRGGLRPP